MAGVLPIEKACILCLLLWKMILLDTIFKRTHAAMNSNIHQYEFDFIFIHVTHPHTFSKTCEELIHLAFTKP